MLNKDSIKRPSSSECLNMIPPQYKPLEFKQNIFKDFSSLFFGIDIPDIPIDIKEEFCEYYYLIYEFPKFSLRDFLCYECEKKNNKIYPFIKVDFHDFLNLKVESYCQNGHYFIMKLTDFYKSFTSSKSYRTDINEIYCTDCKRDNIFYPKQHFKYCDKCIKVLCPRCEIIHSNSNPTHVLKERYMDKNFGCIKHCKTYEYFCKDCLLNLCFDCSVEHEEQNDNHEIIEIKNQIDDETIKEIETNIEEVKKSIIFVENLVKTKQCHINKFCHLKYINSIKLILLYKMTFLNMYKKNQSNFILIKNILDNKEMIPKIELFMELDEYDEKKDKLFEVFNHFSDNTISRYREIINLSLHKNRITSVILYSDYLITFSEDKSIKILDKNNFEMIKEINNQFNLPIYEAIKLRNQDILVGYGNKLRIINFNENEKNITTIQNIDKFTEETISDILELNNGIILVLCNGKLFSLKKKENEYRIYKKFINNKETIYSFIELDENSFLITCQVNEVYEKICHIQIYNSEDISLNYNSCYYFYFTKNKNNLCKFNKDFVLFCLDNDSILSNNGEMLFFNYVDKCFFIMPSNMNNRQVYKIFEKSFIGVTNFNSKYTLNQIEILALNNNYYSQSKAGFLSLSEIIDKIFIIEDMIILLDRFGKIIIYQIENQYLHLYEINMETKIKERNQRIIQRSKITNNNINNSRKNEIENKENRYDNLKTLKDKYDIFETEKNGNCLFESLGKVEGISSSKMRQILTDYIKNNYQNLEGFEQDMILNNESIETYINRMKRPFEYGTFTEISAYSLVFKKRVTIYMIDENGDGKGCINIGDENREITYLLYISQSNNFEGVNHYKLLMKKEENRIDKNLNINHYNH